MGLSPLYGVTGPLLFSHLLAAERPVLVNPFMAKWLSQSGQWDQSGLVGDIRRRSFALIQLGGFAAPPTDRSMTRDELLLHSVTRSRFTPEVLGAVDGAYEIPPALRDVAYPKLYVPRPVEKLRPR